MNANICPRCLDKFYTAVTGVDLTCPFCGFILKYTDVKRRCEMRSTIERGCVLSKDETIVSAKTFDISSKGVGITSNGVLPFVTDEVMNVIVKEFDIDSTARIVWVQKFESAIYKAGLKFC